MRAWTASVAGREMEDSDRMETDSPIPSLGPGPLPGAAAMRQDLGRALAELSFRELASSAQWAAELLAALPGEEEDEDPGLATAAAAGASGARVYASLMLAKSHFAMREYSRAAHALQHIRDLHKNQAALFLRLYSLYMAGEKRREEEVMEAVEPVDKCQVKNMELRGIEEHLAALHGQRLLDGPNLWLYGITLWSLELKEDARRVLLEAVRAFPCHWSAWLDLIALCSDLGDVADIRAELHLPDHWMAWFFQAAYHLELQHNAEALDLYRGLRRFFPDSSYIASQIATCHYNMRSFEESQQSFDEVRRRDPYKLTSLDTYSNILYVKEESAALSHLARQAIRVDKYTPEACCIIGNYYSLKGEHEKSVTYFQRALCLHRGFTPAWILMGHEFMEMKNTPAAIEAYRTAVNINQRDYRAWYGLGQTYELLSLHAYSLLYYRRAMGLRPEDSRMWCAMAQCYDLMDRKGEALRCYEKARRCGDRERVALPRLARLHLDLGDRAQAVSYYGQVLAQHSDEDCFRGARSLGESSAPAEVIEAMRFLMGYYREEGRLADCAACAERLLAATDGGPEREEALSLLRELQGGSAAAPLGLSLMHYHI